MISVLYVDDEPELLEISRLFLEQGGEFTVDVTTSATTALTMIASKNYDAIISDYQMPGMDGIAFLKKVRNSGNAVPFILFTGRGREEIVIQALNEGANFYLQKGGDPVAQFAELTHQVQQAVWQRRAEISIRDLERREADIINFLPDATFAIDRSGRIIAWNRAIEEMTGIPAAEMLGKGNYEYAIPFYGERRPILIDLINEPDDVIAGKYAHIVHKKDVLIADTTLPRPRGKPLMLMGKASPLYNREGEVIGAIESIRDISDMKKAEEDLRESEVQFAAFMDHLPVTAFIKDAESTNLFVNRHMVELFGEQEWIGKPVYDQFPQKAAEKMVEDDRLTLRDGYRKSIEYLVEKNGERKIFETHKFRIDRGNKPPLIGGFAIDITEQKEAEKALNESEMRFRKIFENSPLGMALVTPDFRFFSVNPAWTSMTGYSGEELLKMSFKDITPPDYLAGDLRNMQELAAGTLPVYRTEKKYLKKDGSILWGLIRVTAIRDQEGTLRYFAAQIEDITERKKAEEELRESEERFRRLISGSFDAIVIHRNGRIVLANDAAAHIMKISRAADLVGRKLLDMVHPDYRALVAERIGKMQQFPEGTVPIIEEKFIRDDGTAVDVEVMATATKHEGAPAVIVAFRDNTGRKMAEEILKKSTDRLKRAEEVGRSGSWEFRLSENTVFASDGARALYGLEGEQWTIDGVQKIPLPEYRSRLDAAMRDLIAGRSPYNIEFRIRRPTDGAVLDIHSLAEYDPVHNIVFGVIHDITERKKAEEELIFKNLILSTEQEISLDGILIVDENNRILNYNRNFTDLWGIPEQLIAPRRDEPVLRFVAGQLADPEPFLARVRYLYDHKDEKSFEELRLRDGRILERFSAPIRGEGERYFGRVWYFRDITGRRMAEQALQDVNRKLGLLSKITRHDINNQLTLLQGYQKILLKKIPDLSSCPEFLKAATAAGRITAMIQFTREYEEIGVNAPAWQDCRALVDTAAAQVAPGSIRIVNDLPAGRELFADPLIVRVFYNLMDNAVRHGGKITIIRFFLQESGGDHRILCEDDGEGIPADEKEQIFERNFGRNTGLGLFLSREILGITGITIRETGEPGKGARFEILVPEGACRLSGAGKE